MRRLPDVIKRRIVDHLAAYKGPAQVAKLVSSEFGVTLTPRHVRAYDPTSLQFAASERWREYFKAARNRFAESIAEIPIYHRAYRLHKLEEVRAMAMKQGNVRLAMRALRQAAEEVGHIDAHRESADGSRPTISPAADRPNEGRARSEILADLLEKAMQSPRALKVIEALNEQSRGSSVGAQPRGTVED